MPVAAGTRVFKDLERRRGVSRDTWNMSQTRVDPDPAFELYRAGAPP